ncbi:MAG TPA: hypothetical protein VED40_21415 [Azospirillaceae bacterium]|nr:hypothetical protein [Azospirillaceae bacterium]
MKSRTAELRLDELLRDPMVRLVMERDGVLPEEVTLLMRETAERWAVRERILQREAA